MRIFYAMSLAGSALGLVLAGSMPTLAAETCPIYNIETRQMEPVPTLTAWALGDDDITGTITADDPDGLVNVRENAGTEFKVVATAQPTEAVVLTDHALSMDCRNWFKVTFADGRTGWVHPHYVESDRAFSPF